jgi:mannose/fructose/N-acetylgalactosamine-specific phosphotransferase system component IIC
MSFKKAIGAPLASLIMIFTIFVFPAIIIFFVHKVREQAIETLEIG